MGRDSCDILGSVYRHENRADIFAFRTTVVLIMLDIASHDGRANYICSSHDGLKNNAGEKKLLTGTFNLYVKLGYKFSLSCEYELQFPQPYGDNIGNRHDLSVDNIC